MKSNGCAVVLAWFCLLVSVSPMDSNHKHRLFIVPRVEFSQLQWLFLFGHFNAPIHRLVKHKVYSNLHHSGFWWCDLHWCGFVYWWKRTKLFDLLQTHHKIGIWGIPKSTVSIEYSERRLSKKQTKWRFDTAFFCFSFRRRSTTREQCEFDHLWFYSGIQF